jgi:hypothetical protein
MSDIQLSSYYTIGMNGLHPPHEGFLPIICSYNQARICQVRMDHPGTGDALTESAGRAQETRLIISFKPVSFRE